MSIKGGPNIVTDGLVLHLDAADSNSYPGSGFTWIDLSGNGNDGTLVNGVGYSSNNVGNLSFDGTNDRVDCGTSFQNVLTDTNNFSICCFVYPENTQPTYADIWGNHTAPYKGIVCQQNGNTLNQYSIGWGTGSSWSQGTGMFNLNTQEWNYLCFTRDNSILTVYLNNNAIKISSDSSSIMPNLVFNFQIGTGYDLSSGRKFRGNISNFTIHSKALSNIEIQRNYNALKGRFGL